MHYLQNLIDVCCHRNPFILSYDNELDKDRKVEVELIICISTI